MELQIVTMNISHADIRQPWIKRLLKAVSSPLWPSVAAGQFDSSGVKDRLRHLRNDLRSIFFVR